MKNLTVYFIIFFIASMFVGCSSKILPTQAPLINTKVCDRTPEEQRKLDSIMSLDFTTDEDGVYNYPPDEMDTYDPQDYNVLLRGRIILPVTAEDSLKGTKQSSMEYSFIEWDEEISMKLHSFQGHYSLYPPPEHREPTEQCPIHVFMAIKDVLEGILAYQVDWSSDGEMTNIWFKSLTLQKYEVHFYGKPDLVRILRITDELENKLGVIITKEYWSKQR